MNLKNFIKTNALALVAVATIVGFSAFKSTDAELQQARMTVAVYFQGNPTVVNQVQNEALWSTTPNGQTCNNTNQKACLQLVEHTDLTATNTLDPAKIDLGEVNSGAGYIPTRIGGSSSTPFFAINRT